MSAAIYLNQARQGTIRRGHPWVFPKAILRQTPQVKTGQLVDVFSSDGEKVGVGVYNEHSLYRVRILAYAFENINTDSIPSIVAYRLKQAIELRNLLLLPNALTTAYRLVNSEGDGLSGLTMDCFNDVIVVSSTAYWVQAHKESICSMIREQLNPEKIIWLAQSKPLAQDGWLLENSNEASGNEVVLEAGIRYQVDFSNTQKTGLFIDQRENHQRLAALVKDKRVLDLYTYTGGFALHAAKAGARCVTAVDSSAQAIVLAKQNAALNACESIDFIEADARDYLVKAGDYDVIILDPPKLVPSQRHAEKAKNYYRFLHREVFKHMRPGTLLMTCNCSSALSSEEFSELVSSQAMVSGKIARTIGVYGPASCHPTLAVFPEGRYLTAVLLAVL
jgi:23S rRNA (cytosine1962-C5)-methyltransferase